MKLLVRKEFGDLVPTDDLGRDVLAKIKHGTVVEIELKRKRNIKFHRLFMALVSIVWDNSDHEIYPSFDDMRDAITIAAGHRIRLKLKEGDAFMAKSISFGSMTEDAFRTFFDTVCNVVCASFLPGVSDKQLRAEISQMVGVPVDMVA